MRITSPKKYQGQNKIAKSPIRSPSKFNSILKDQAIVHKLKSPRTSNKNNKLLNSSNQFLYQNLRQKQSQYIDLIRNLHQQNNSLKQQLGRLNHHDSQQFHSNRSPYKVKLNQTMYNINQSMNQSLSLNNSFGAASNSSFYKTTTDQFYHQSRNNQKLRQNVSPFSKKPLIPQHIMSPACIRPTLVVRKSVSPFKVSFENIPSKIMINNSPQKKPNHHSYNPSLMTYQGPTPIQSLAHSPKKSFESIAGLNSQIFSSIQGNNENKQNLQMGVKSAKKQNKNSQSNFFDMKKRELNYGFVYQKQRQLKKNHQTIIKIGSQKSMLLNNDTNVKILEIQQQNPINSKRNKSVTKDLQKQVVGHKHNKTQICEKLDKKFNLEQNINKNELMSMLKDKLQQQIAKQTDQQVLKKLSNQQKIEKQQFTNHSQYNQNIRFTEQTFQPNNKSIPQPLRNSILQGFPVLNRFKQAIAQNQQLQSMIIRQQENFRQIQFSQVKQTTNNQNFSNMHIQEVKSCPRTPTIVRMLKQTQQNQKNQQQNNQSIDYQHQDFQNNTIKNQLYSMNLVEMDAQVPSHNSQPQISSNKDNKVQINNRYYCKITQENQSKVSKVNNQKNDFKNEQDQEERNESKKVKVSINQDKNITSYLESQKILEQLQNSQNQSNDTITYQQPEQGFKKQQCERNNNIQKNQTESECPFENYVSKSQYSVALSQKSKMSESSQYQLFYKTRSKQGTTQQLKKYKNKSQAQKHNAKQDKTNIHQQTTRQDNSQLFANFKRQSQRFDSKNPSQRNYSECNVSKDVSFSSTLRSQKFKKISNKAYL